MLFFGIHSSLDTCKMCFIVLTAKVAEGGECCDAHYDVATRKVINDRWCDDYCCLSGTQYICCSNPSCVRHPRKGPSSVETGSHNTCKNPYVVYIYACLGCRLQYQCDLSELSPLFSFQSQIKYVNITSPTSQK